MKRLNIEALSRRAFLIRSAVVVGGVSPLIRVFPASALAALQDRPALSQSSLSGYIQMVRSRGAPEVRALVSEVRGDLRNFLRNRFALDPAQEAFVARLSAKNLADIGTAFERGLASGNDLRFQIPEPGLMRGKSVAESCDLSVNRLERPRVPGVGAETWSVVVVRP